MEKSDLVDEAEGFWNYFKHEAAPTIRKHQCTVNGNEKEVDVGTVPLTLETFAAEVLWCIRGLHVHKVMHTYTTCFSKLFIIT